MFDAINAFCMWHVAVMCCMQKVLKLMDEAFKGQDNSNTPNRKTQLNKKKKVQHADDDSDDNEETQQQQVQQQQQQREQQRQSRIELQVA